MALVAFLRAANVGGHKVFRPAEVPGLLRPWRVANEGAAGTFVVLDEVGADEVRAALARVLPFAPEAALVPAERVRAWLDEGPDPALGKRFVSVLLDAPATPTSLPIRRPDGPDWEVSLERVVADAAFSAQRGAPPHKVYPNEHVERVLGVRATTRGWSTVERLVKRLDGR